MSNRVLHSVKNGNVQSHLKITSIFSKKISKKDLGHERNLSYLSQMKLINSKFSITQVLTKRCLCLGIIINLDAWVN